MPLIQAPKRQTQKPIQRKHAFAAHVAIDNGIMCMCQYAPVLDVGCNNPYDGMWRWLQKMDYRGQYVGIDDNIPADVRERFRGDIFIRQCKIDGARLPFPPSERHKIKEYSTAFCVDTLARIQDRDALIMEMRRIAAQVVVVGGVSVADLKRWGFQYIGLEAFGSAPEAWGVWMNDWAYKTRARLDVTPSTTSGYFGSDNGVEKKQLYHCSKCGVLDYGGDPSFGCAECGTPN
jgi:hypothetical protein